jgi:signal transduction histidine kinase/ActR/RegA family two-component response regulator
MNAAGAPEGGMTPDTLLAAITRLARLGPPERLVLILADAVEDHLGFESGSIRLLEGEELVLAGRWGDPARAPARLGLHEGVEGRAVTTAAPVVQTAPSGLAAAGRATDEGTLVAAPLRIGSRVTGVLALVARRPVAGDDARVRLVQMIADHVAIAIENWRRFDGAARESHALRRIGLDLARALELPQVLQYVVDAARQQTRGDAAFCALIDPDTSEVETIASSGGQLPAASRLALAPGRSIGGAIAQDKRPFRTDDCAADARVSVGAADLAGLEGAVAVLAVPILHQAALIGFLWVINRTRRPFGDQDEAFIQELADHAAGAIMNARRHADQARALENLKTSQERLVNVERLRALGEMANGVAHDFNNLLAVILGRAQLLLRQVKEPGLRAGLQVIEATAVEAAKRVRRIQEFTRTRQHRAYAPVALDQLARDALELTRNRWKDEAQLRGVTYTIKADLESVPPVTGDAAELREVFANLLMNAFDAMPQGGTVWVSVTSTDDRVIASVRDTGPGMPSEVQRRVFEPFFTTRGPQRSGLGLSVVYGVVQRHQGSIDVRSEAGGTCFTVALPAVVEPPPSAPPTPPARPAPRAARVLVVEDDPLVRQVLDEVLRAAGHSPALAEDGTSALARLDPTAPPSLALVDLGLPGMPGLEVATRLHEVHPELPVVLVTGWADRLEPEDLQAARIRRVISKPFRAEEILRAVQEITETGLAPPDPAGPDPVRG